MFKTTGFSLLVILLLSIVSTFSSVKADYDACANPIVLVPGLGGCVLDFYLTNEYQHLYWECAAFFPKNKWSSGLTRLWPSIAAVDSIPPHHLRDCWVNMMQVHFDPVSGNYSNTKGVTVRGRDFGGVSGIDNLFDVTSNWGPGIGAVYEALIKKLKATPGYTVGKNIRGAPYDFRLIADNFYLEQEYAQLKNLIEETYNFTLACSSGPKRVHVMTHSLGGPYFNYFLNTYVTRQWKDKYLRSFMAVSSPWQGAAKAYRTLISGDSEGLPGGNFPFLAVEQLMGGLLWMLPYSKFFNQTFIEMLDTGAQFSASPNDIAKLFNSLQGADRALVPAIFDSHIYPKTLIVEAPETDLYCIHGYGLTTENYFIYSSINNTEVDPLRYREDVVVNGQVVLKAPTPELLIPLNSTNPYLNDPVQGDGTVELVGLEYCLNWVNNNGGKNVSHITFAQQEHLGILSSPEFVNAMLPLITAP